MGLLFVHTATAADAVTLELSAGNVACENVVVETALPSSLADHDHFALTQIDTGERIPVQVDRNGGEPKLVWVVRDKLDAGTRRRYRLTSVTGPSQPNHVTVTDDGKRLLVKVGVKPVFSYNHATVPSPDPKHPYYARSGYIHPLYNPSGQIVTDDFNPDHAHQHGIMLAWRKMTFDGRATNGWDQQAGLGKVEHAQLETFGGGPVFGFFKARLSHVDLTAPGEPTSVLNEIWYVRIYAFDDAFQFDITSTQECASAKPVSIDTIHYGGMTIRGHADWHEHGNFDYLTDEGKSKTNGNQTRPRWVDLFGPIAGQTTGTLIMDHESNFRFPQPVRLHPTMPYFCFTPASLDSFTIQPGTPYVSRYRFYVHDASLDANIADRLWDQYSHAPKVQIAKSAE
ncbi:MAG: PmoA family protein [Fuerstiella sp.]